MYTLKSRKPVKYTIIIHLFYFFMLYYKRCLSNELSEDTMLQILKMGFYLFIHFNTECYSAIIKLCAFFVVHTTAYIVYSLSRLSPLPKVILYCAHIC